MSIYCRNCQKEKEQNEYNLCFQCRTERLNIYYDKMKKPELKKRYCQSTGCNNRLEAHDILDMKEILLNEVNKIKILVCKDCYDKRQQADKKAS